MSIIAPYRSALAIPGLGRVLLLGALIRTPLFAGFVVMTLHLVQHLGVSYREAGLVTLIYTATTGVSSPVRGRVLDRQGLRRTMLPCLIVSALVWAVAPFLPYLGLLACAVVGGWFAVPGFAIIRKMLLAGTPLELRRTTLSLDSVVIELCFMAGPLAGAWAATKYPTPWVLLGVNYVGLIAAVVLYALNPSLAGAAEAPTSAHGEPDAASARLLTPALWVVLLVSAVGSFTFTATDLSTIAALRGLGHVGAVGVLFALWGAGSLVGGVLYGTMRRPIGLPWLMVALGAVTAVAAFAHSVVTLGAALVVAGLLCAPVMIATTEEVGRLVPEHRLGAAMGVHSSAVTTGGAISGPVVGAVLDAGGPAWGFGGTGAAVAVVGVSALAANALWRPGTGRGDAAGAAATREPEG